MVARLPINRLPRPDKRFQIPDSRLSIRPSVPGPCRLGRRGENGSQLASLLDQPVEFGLGRQAAVAQVLESEERLIGFL